MQWLELPCTDTIGSHLFLNAFLNVSSEEKIPVFGGVDPSLILEISWCRSIIATFWLTITFSVSLLVPFCLLLTLSLNPKPATTRTTHAVASTRTIHANH
jgi:hypothetical protein